MSADWPTIALRDLCSIARGGSPRPIKNFITNDPNGINWIKIGDTQKGGRYIDNTAEKIKPEGISRSRFVEAGSFLLSNSMSFGRPYILRTSGCIHDGWLVLEPDYERVDQDFLYHVLGSRTVFDQFDRLAAGSTVRNLNIALVEGVEIPLPPLEDQQRIVAVLDEAFEGLARARAHAEANLQNARELSEASVEAVFDRLPDSTPVDELQSFCTERGITYGVIKLGDHDPEGVPCLRTSNVRPLHIDTKGMKWIRPELSEEYRRTILEGGEVLVNVRGTLGGVAAVPDEMAGWNISREVAMVPVDRARLDPDFASFFISTRKAQQWLTGVVKGAAYKGINLTDLRLLKIPVPSLKAQDEIIDEIKELRERMIVAEVACERKLQDLDDLRQSLLQKAFAGELT